MLQPGKTQTLTVDHFAEAGAYLREGAETVLLPKRCIPEGTETGDSLRVFLYRDSEDRLVATTEKPALELGGAAALKVAEVTKIGAFLDWGLPKDLLLPFHEMRGPVKAGQTVFVRLYLDRSGRLAATMHVDRAFRADPPYRRGDRVKGTVYGVNPEIGAFVAVDGKYAGLIPRQEIYGNIEIGQAVEARVASVRPDGKLNLSLRRKAYRQMEEDGAVLLEHIRAAGGVLGIGDKSDPAFVKAELSMSKSAFKRAAGHLQKEGKIRVGDESVALTEPEQAAGPEQTRKPSRTERTEKTRKPEMPDDTP